MPTNPAGRLLVGRSFRELIWEWRRVQWSQNKLLVEKGEEEEEEEGKDLTTAAAHSRGA